MDTTTRKSALVIGGTKGLGLELANRAVDGGMSVTVLGRNPASCPLVMTGEASAIKLDLEQPPEGFSMDLIGPFDLIFWVAGVYQFGPFFQITSREIERLFRVHLTGPMHILRDLFYKSKQEQRPCHLVVVASTSSYRAREDESIYDATKAAQAQFARVLGKELPRDIPGSKVLLANPGGMATPFWDGRDRDVSNFMRPEDVAWAIWVATLPQEVSFLEVQVLRQPDRSPRIEYGPRMPE